MKLNVQDLVKLFQNMFHLQVILSVLFNSLKGHQQGFETRALEKPAHQVF